MAGICPAQLLKFKTDVGIMLQASLSSQGRFRGNQGGPRFGGKHIYGTRVSIPKSPQKSTAAGCHLGVGPDFRAASACEVGDMAPRCTVRSLRLGAHPPPPIRPSRPQQGLILDHSSPGSFRAALSDHRPQGRESRRRSVVTRRLGFPLGLLCRRSPWVREEQKESPPCPCLAASEQRQEAGEKSVP